MYAESANRSPSSKLTGLLGNKPTLIFLGLVCGLLAERTVVQWKEHAAASAAPKNAAHKTVRQPLSSDSNAERAVAVLDDFERALAEHGNDTPWDSPDIRVAALSCMEAFPDAGEAHILSRIRKNQWTGIRALLIEFARAKPSVVTKWLGEGLIADTSSFSALAAMLAGDRGMMLRFIAFAKASGLSRDILTELYLRRDPALLLEAAGELELEGEALRELQIKCGLRQPDLLLKCISLTGELSQQEKLQLFMALGNSPGADDDVWKKWLAVGGAKPEMAAHLLNGLGPGTFAPLVKPVAEVLAANATDTNALLQSLRAIQSRPTLTSLGNEIAAVLPLAPSDASAVIDLLAQNGCGYEKQSPEQIRASLWQTYLNGLAEREPLTALNEWKNLEGDSASNDRLRRQFASALAAAKTVDPQQLLASIGPKGANPDPGLLAAYVLQAASSDGVTVPPHVSSWLVANEVEPEMLLSQLGSVTGETEFEAGLEALARVSGASENLRRGVQEMVTGRWEKEPLTVAVWVEGMAPGTAQDQVLFAIASQLQRQGETQAAAAWAARITDPAVADAILTGGPK